jgi:hypothetical protein
MKITVKYRHEERCIFLLNFEIFHSIFENVAFYIFASGFVQGLPRTFVTADKFAAGPDLAEFAQIKFYQTN